MEFLGLFGEILGSVLLALMIIGIATFVVKPLFRGTVASGPAGMFALLLSVWIFHSLVPAGVEDRKLIIAVPAMVLFVFAGARWLADNIPVPGSVLDWRLPAIAAFAAVSFMLETFRIPKVPHCGYKEIAAYLTSRTELQHSKILVSSEAGGEGLLVSEIAMKEPRPSDSIIRATKALASVEWNGSSYRCVFTTPEQILNYLEQENIQIIVVDNLSPQVRFQHDALLKQTLKDSRHFSAITSFPPQASDRGTVTVYKLRS